MFVVRYDAVVDRVGVVQLAAAGDADQLLQPTCQSLQLDVVDAAGQHDDVVTERRNGVDTQLSRLQRLLGRLHIASHANNNSHTP